MLQEAHDEKQKISIWRGIEKKLGITDAELMYYILEEDLTALSESLEPFDKEEFRRSEIGTYAYFMSDWPMAGFDGLLFSVLDFKKLKEKLTTDADTQYSKDNKKFDSAIAQDDRKLRPDQRHRLNCRKIAKEKWKKDPTITIADMAISDEIAKACDNKLYTEITICNWIKDLCPNRSPGRRKRN